MEKKAMFALVIFFCILINIMLRFSRTNFVRSPEYSFFNMHPVYCNRTTNCTNGSNLPDVQTNGSLLSVTSKVVLHDLIYSTTAPSPKNSADTLANLTVQRHPQSMPRTPVTKTDLYCRLKKVRFSTMTRASPPFNNPGVSPYFPKESLENLVHYNSCAVVSSSHGLKLHHYGHDIDSHDAVLRFNCAPTDGFSVHVGSRTDIRLINTQIPQKTCTNEFWDRRIKMFNNETVVIRNFDSIRVIRGRLDTRLDRYRSLDNYIRYRKMYPNGTMHFIQRPNFGTDVQKELTRFCKETTDCKPGRSRKSPSSGSLGVIMMLHLCDWVYTYEMVPSTVNRTRLAYYYNETINMSTVHHSINTEREYWKALTVTSLEEVERTGVAVLQGLSQHNCT
ncbi:beta-galactoside alpha-2,6-sialyltransferase 1-like [Branchiostoma lanceolatum]|uniref:beta-galactoside alpha-2,6-sialyltransferase 1-like n=1 Tax=Branchiostoma lanceolatum TaxID=7740 RepID=UPI003453C2EE